MTVVAIDGPAGAGKSTVARAVAERLGWAYLDTGAMYRAVALAAIEAGVDPSDRAAVERLAIDLPISVNGSRVLLDGRDPGPRIRRSDVTAAVSMVSAHPGVRRALVTRQQDAAHTSDVVIEGRDIGTAVVPTADYKIFLTAEVRERARRRCRQLDLPMDDATLDRVEAEIVARDRADATRDASPLAVPLDALVIDSTDMTFDAVVDRVVAVVATDHDS